MTSFRFGDWPPYAYRGRQDKKGATTKPTWAAVQ